MKVTGGAASYKTVFERGVFEVLITVDGNRIGGMLVKPWKETTVAKITRNTTKLALPFTGAWTVVWGGDTKEQNYHIAHEAQKGAFDLVITDGAGKSYKTDGKNNSDYYAFGKQLLAPCDGEVVMVVDGIKDNAPGEMNPVYVPGNTVVIKTAANEYLFFAHFQHRTIKVKEGDRVKAGQLLGLCGNSGNSSEPHLHFHIQDAEDMTKAVGVKCYFEALKVNGVEKQDYSPVQGEVVSGK
ncbi:MAG: peptidase [Flaviaesturariibacter sp.]|nr:peptidase [Flaviaesturariibacter sp.]